MFGKTHSCVWTACGCCCCGRVLFFGWKSFGKCCPGVKMKNGIGRKNTFGRREWTSVRVIDWLQGRN
jgi:hypothetical protein